MCFLLTVFNICVGERKGRVLGTIRRLPGTSKDSGPEMTVRGSEKKTLTVREPMLQAALIRQSSSSSSNSRAGVEGIERPIMYENF